MKKIISGAVYNTETAKQIGAWGSGAEELYITKAGKYFLCHPDGTISPQSPEKAMAWAEKRLPTDAYITLFGDPEEASDTKDAIKLSISKGLKRKLEKLRSEQGRSISAIISALVEEKLKGGKLKWKK